MKTHTHLTESAYTFQNEGRTRDAESLLASQCSRKVRTDAALMKQKYLTPENLRAIRENSDSPTLNPLLNGNIDPTLPLSKILQRLKWLERLHNEKMMRRGQQ